MAKKANKSLFRLPKIKVFKGKKALVKVLLVIFVVLVLSYLAYTIAYANKIYPNVYVADHKLSGLKKEKAKELINQAINQNKPEKAKIVYQENGQNWEINLESIDFEYKLDKTTEKVWAIGRRLSLLDTLKDHFLVLFRPYEMGIEVDYDQNKLTDIISKIAYEVDQPKQVFSFVLEDGQIKEKPGKEGLAVKKEELEQDFKDVLSNLKDEVVVKTEKLIPKVTGKEEETKAAREKFEKMVDSPISFVFKSQKFTALPSEIAEWAQFSERPIMPANYILDLELNDEKVLNFINSLAKKTNQEPRDAKLTMAGDRLAIVQSEQDGYELDKQHTLNQIKAIAFSDTRRINLKLEVVQPAIRAETINNLGIKELIGEGTSSFARSPKNRIHNINVGANLFNGATIAPGETFSFNKVLGEVSAKKGFLPELVIKEDRLIPETGGGLCQVSTTMFRAAVYSGLEVTERQPHSFRVSYYEPPLGLDATVYSPRPDLRFKNDTPGYILIQTRISGLKLTFQFYGTKDGRTVKIDGPHTSDYRSPGAATYIDDPSLPAGELKQIGRAVAGVTAIIQWTVYKNNKVLHQKTFVSKYEAWPAKYKRGTGPPAEPPPEEPAPAEQPPSE